MSTTSAQIMRRLYRSEINVAVSSMWDGGWTWQLGDDYSGFSAGGRAEDWDSTIYALADAAMIEFPESDFANFWKFARKNYWPKKDDAP